MALSDLLVMARATSFGSAMAAGGAVNVNVKWRPREGEGQCLSLDSQKPQTPATEGHRKYTTQLHENYEPRSTQKVDRNTERTVPGTGGMDGWMGWRRIEDDFRLVIRAVY